MLKHEQRRVGHGGAPPPARSNPAPLQLPPWPVHDEAEIAAVAEVLRSGRTNYWTGTHCREFERAFASYIGVPRALSVANGTVGLELALAALGVGPGDEVIVPGRSFIGTASAVTSRGAKPVFVDIEFASQGLCPLATAAAITPRTRAIVAVHLAGWPCDVIALQSLARRRSLSLIEDCAQAHGARVGGRSVGSFGDAAVFSFCQDKIMSTAGEGGMVTFADKGLYERAWSRREHGKRPPSRYKPLMAGYQWIHEGAGTNGRMTECQAAVGLVQLRRLDRWVRQRGHNAQRLAAALDRAAGVSVPRPGPGLVHAYYRLSVHLPRARRDSVLAALRGSGVPASVGVCPELYRERALARHAPSSPLPICVRVGASILSLPVHPTLAERDIDAMAGLILNNL